MLPQVRDLVARVVELSAYLPEVQEQVRTAEYVRGRPGAGAEELDRLEQALAELRAGELELTKAAMALEAMSVSLKDPLIGLVDFPAIMEGEVVELCWKLGEERVAYWHRLGEGYRGRKPL